MSAYARELYDWIEANPERESFRNADVAEDLGLTGADVSILLDAYQRWQRGKNVSPRFVIHRRAGTRATSTVWDIGTGVTDVRDIGAQLASDVRVRVEGAIRPLLRTILRENPRVRRQVEATEAAVGGIAEILVATLYVGTAAEERELEEVE